MAIISMMFIHQTIGVNGDDTALNALFGLVNLFYWGLKAFIKIISILIDNTEPHSHHKGYHYSDGDSFDLSKRKKNSTTSNLTVSETKRQNKIENILIETLELSDKVEIVKLDNVEKEDGKQ